MTAKPTEHEIDPLLTAMLVRLAVEGPKWTSVNRERWCGLFAGVVMMLYPGRAPRKSRAKKPD